MRDFVTGSGGPPDNPHNPFGFCLAVESEESKRIRAQKRKEDHQKAAFVLCLLAGTIVFFCGKVLLPSEIQGTVRYLVFFSLCVYIAVMAWRTLSGFFMAALLMAFIVTFVMAAAPYFTGIPPTNEQPGFCEIGEGYARQKTVRTTKGVTEITIYPDNTRVEEFQGGKAASIGSFVVGRKSYVKVYTPDGKILKGREAEETARQKYSEMAQYAQEVVRQRIAGE